MNEDDIQLIIDETLSQQYWEFNLGIKLQYEWAPENIKYSAPYFEMGKELWEALNYELYDLLCDSKSNQPKIWLSDLLTGDIRNLIIGIGTAITSEYNVTVGIAVPVTALILKTKVLNFCSTDRPKNPKKSVKQILEEKRKNFQKQPRANNSDEK